MTTIQRPNEVEAERQVLTACLKTDQDDVVKVACAELTPDNFAHPRYREVFTSLAGAVHDTPGEPVSWLEIQDRIPSDSPARETLAEMVGSTDLPAITTAYIKKQIEKLHNAYKARRIATLIKSANTRAMSNDAQGAYDVLIEGVFEIGRDRFTSGAQHIEHYIDQIKESVTERRLGGGVVGLSTGLAPFDDVFGGLQRKKLYYLGARPGMYKSAVAGQVTYSVAHSGHRTLLASPEMAAEEYILRIACKFAKVDYDAYNRGLYDEGQEQLIHEVLEAMRHENIIINESGMQDTISLRQDIIRFQPELLVIDYGQLFDPSRPAYNEYKDVTLFSKELNAIKKDFGIPIMACVQLSRKVEERDDKRPVKSDLRSSGQIEQDADGIFMLYHAKEYAKEDELGNWYIEKWATVDGKNTKIQERIEEDTVEFVCAKNRNGKRRDVTCYVKEGQMWLHNER